MYASYSAQERARHTQLTHSYYNRSLFKYAGLFSEIQVSFYKWRYGVIFSLLLRNVRGTRSWHFFLLTPFFADTSFCCLLYRSFFCWSLLHVSFWRVYIPFFSRTISVWIVRGARSWRIFLGLFYMALLYVFVWRVCIPFSSRTRSVQIMRGTRSWKIFLGC